VYRKAIIKKKKSASEREGPCREYRKLGYAQRNLNICIDFSIVFRSVASWRSKMLKEASNV